MAGESAARKKQPYLKSLLFTFVAIVVLIGLVEGIGRLVYYVQQGATFESTHRVVYNFFGYARHVDEPIRYRARPNYSTPEVYINSLGFRGPEITVPKEDGVYRILVLGDSTTFGLGATSNETMYTAVLECILNEGRNGRRFEVINGGLPGYNSFQATLVLKEVGAAVEPDLVMVFVGINDLRAARDLGERWYPEATEMDFLSDRGWMAERIRYFLHERSLLYALAKGTLAWFRPAYKAAAGEVAPSLYNNSEGHPVFQNYEQNLLQIVQLSGKLGARVWLLTWPWREDEDANPILQLGKQEALASMGRISLAEGGHLVDLEGGFNAQGRKDRLFVDGVHFSDEGHHLTAELIFRELLARSIAR